MDWEVLQQRYRSAIATVNAAVSFPPALSVILGSGLSPSVNATILPYTHIPGLPIPTVAGHRGELLCVSSEAFAKSILLWKGRFHFYEGYRWEEIVAPVVIAAAVGCQTLLVTNAAGGLNPYFEVGDLMLIRDHINFFPAFPGWQRHRARNQCYDPSRSEALLEIAVELGVRMQQGTYIGVPGPNYETPAEVQFYTRIGGDAIGMSTVLEVEAAVALGMKVVGCSVITNVLSAASHQGVSHQEVLRVSKRTSALIAQMLVALCDRHLPIFL